MRVTREMELTLIRWANRFAMWRPSFVAMRLDVESGVCCAVVWHRREPWSMQAIELHVCEDLAVCAYVHPPEPLRAEGELLA